MRVGFLAEGAKNIFWPWLFPLRQWGRLTMTSIGKFVYRAHHFVELRLNSFGLRVDRGGIVVSALYVIVAGFLVSQGF